MDCVRENTTPVSYTHLYANEAKAREMAESAVNSEVGVGTERRQPGVVGIRRDDAHLAVHGLSLIHI